MWGSLAISFLMVETGPSEVRLTLTKSVDRQSVSSFVNSMILEFVFVVKSIYLFFVFVTKSM
jgi:hypothetical protein